MFRGKIAVHNSMIFIIHITAPGVIEVNPEFEITKITDLLELSNWAHHTTYILPQVRALNHTVQSLPSPHHTPPLPLSGTYNMV